MKLGEQWIEIIDGQEHMVKCVGIRNPVITDGNNFITKDLGILKDGCLPCPFCGKYPDIKDGGNVNLNYVFCHNSHIVKTICYPTIQQAIDEWNRRA